MQKIPQLLLIAVLSFVLSSCGTPSANLLKEPEIHSLTGEFKIKKVQFKNGLRLLILKDDSSPTFAYQTWFNVGSRNEVPGKTGLAHLFEHMMFKGTKSHPSGEFDALLEEAGVEGENAFTTNDHTVYIQELPKEHLDLIIQLESDRMNHLIVNDESFNTEREVVQNERRFRKENSPEGTLYQSLFETAFQESPYHWPVIGYEQDLRLMGAQDAREFYEHFYSPDRATIVVVGDVDEADVIRKVEKAYSSIPARNIPDGEFKKDPDQSAQRRKKIPLNIQSDKLWIAFKIPEGTHPDSPALEVIQGLLSDGKSSRLNRALVDAGISTSIESGSLGMKGQGLFVFMSDLQKGKSAGLAESIILREIEKLKSTPVSEEELQRAKNRVRFQFFQKLSTHSGKANFIGESESRLGSIESGLSFQNSILKITPDDVLEMTKKYFQTKGMTVLTGVPKL